MTMMDSTSFAVASALGLIGFAVTGVWYSRELQRREHQRALERQQQLHAERLAAIGAMAAGVLREIRDPIAAIDGYARAIVDAQRRGEIPPPPAPDCDPALIVEEANRLVVITHGIAELTAPPPKQCQLVSVNDVVAQALALLRYDERLARVNLQTALDAQLPAVAGSADRLVLLVTHLVAFALDGGADTVIVLTQPEGTGVALEVSGNGHGPPGDLPLARAIAAEHGGLIEVNWNPQTGTGVRVTLEGAPLH